MTAVQTLVVIAKQPVPGRVKTRLIGPCTAAEAAELARAAVLDTLAALADVASQRRIVLFDGDPTGLVPADWQVMAQADGDLDERLATGFDALPAGPALLVGMDTPQLRAEHLNFQPAEYDACLGLASDGGYWAIGFADPSRAGDCIRGVPMSTDYTGSAQLRRLSNAGLRVQQLPVLTDVDTQDSADEVAQAAPQTGFARLWRDIRQEAG